MTYVSPPVVTLDSLWKHPRHNGHFDRLCIGAVEDSKDASLSCPETHPLSRRCVAANERAFSRQHLFVGLSRHRTLEKRPQVGRIVGIKVLARFGFCCGHMK